MCVCVFGLFLRSIPQTHDTALARQQCTFIIELLSKGGFDVAPVDLGYAALARQVVDCPSNTLWELPFFTSAHQ